MIHELAECCSMLQYLAARGSVWQYVAACCSLLCTSLQVLIGEAKKMRNTVQCHDLRTLRVLQCVAVCGSAWQCVAVCCSVLQHAAVCC